MSPSKMFKFNDSKCLVVSYVSSSDETLVSANPTNRKVCRQHAKLIVLLVALLRMQNYYLQIFGTDVNFWKYAQDGIKLCLLERNNMYPPRVVFEVDCCSPETFKLTFNFDGCTESLNLSAEVLFPLIGPQRAASSQLAL